MRTGGKQGRGGGQEGERAEEAGKKESGHRPKRGFKTVRSSRMRFPRVRSDSSEVSMLQNSGAAQ